MYEIYFDELKIENLKDQMEEINHSVLIPLIQNINIAINDMNSNVFLQAEYLLDKINQSTEKIEHSMYHSVNVLSKINLSYSQTAKNIDQNLEDILTEQRALYKDEEINQAVTSSTIAEFYQNLRQLNAYLIEGIALQINPISISKYQKAFGGEITDVVTGHGDIQHIIFSENASEISLSYVEELQKVYEQLEVPYMIKPYSLLNFKKQALNLSVDEDSSLRSYTVNYKDIFNTDLGSVEDESNSEISFLSSMESSPLYPIHIVDDENHEPLELHVMNKLFTDKEDLNFVGLRNFLLNKQSDDQNDSLKMPEKFLGHVHSFPFGFVKDTGEHDGSGIGISSHSSIFDEIWRFVEDSQNPELRSVGLSPHSSDFNTTWEFVKDREYSNIDRFRRDLLGHEISSQLELQINKPTIIPPDFWPSIQLIPHWFVEDRQNPELRFVEVSPHNNVFNKIWEFAKDNEYNNVGRFKRNVNGDGIFASPEFVVHGERIPIGLSQFIESLPFEFVDDIANRDIRFVEISPHNIIFDKFWQFMQDKEYSNIDRFKRDVNGDRIFTSPEFVVDRERIPTELSQFIESLPFKFVDDIANRDIRFVEISPRNIIFDKFWQFMQDKEYSNIDRFKRDVNEDGIFTSPEFVKDRANSELRFAETPAHSIIFDKIWKFMKDEEYRNVDRFRPDVNGDGMFTSPEFVVDEVNRVELIPTEFSNFIKSLPFELVEDRANSELKFGKTPPHSIIFDKIWQFMQDEEYRNVDRFRPDVNGDGIFTSSEFVEGYDGGDFGHLKYEIPEERAGGEFKPIEVRDELSKFISSIPFKFIRSDHEYIEDLPHIAVSRFNHSTRVVIPDINEIEDFDLVKVTPFSPSLGVPIGEPDLDPERIYDLKYNHRYDTEMGPVLSYLGESVNLQKVQINSVNLTEKKEIKEDRNFEPRYYENILPIEKIVRDFVEDKHNDDLSRLKYKIEEGRVTEFKPLKLRDELSTFVSSVPFKFVRSEYDNELAYTAINKVKDVQKIKTSNLYEDEEFDLLRVNNVSHSTKIKNEQLDPDTDELYDLKYGDRHDTQMKPVLTHEDEEAEDLRKVQIDSLKASIKEDIINDSNFFEGIVDEVQLKAPELREIFEWSYEQAEQLIDKLYASTEKPHASYMQDGGKSAYTLVLTMIVQHALQLGGGSSAKSSKVKNVSSSIRIVDVAKKHKSEMKSLNASLFATDEEIAMMKYSAFESSAGKAVLGEYTNIKPVNAVGAHYDTMKLNAVQGSIQKEAEQAWNRVASAALVGVQPSERVSINRIFPLITPAGPKKNFSEDKMEVVDNLTPVKSTKNFTIASTNNMDESMNTIEGIDFIDHNTSANLSSSAEFSLSGLSTTAALLAFSASIKKKEDELLAISIWKNSVYESVIKQACESEMLESASRLLEEESIFKEPSGGKARLADMKDISPVVVFI